MGGVGPMGGVPVVSAGGPLSATNTMLSPGGHSPGPPGSTIAPSPTHRLGNVPSPGVALNTPGMYNL